MSTLVKVHYRIGGTHYNSAHLLQEHRTATEEYVFESCEELLQKFPPAKSSPNLITSIQTALGCLQELDLTAGDRATCTAGYPHKGTIIVECIKSFNSPRIWSKEWDDIINNPHSYVKVVDGGRYGALTSHWISSDWTRL